ncbi:MAG: hypothetical protein ABR551_10065 [Gemmatimonadales bacterium]
MTDRPIQLLVPPYRVFIPFDPEVVPPPGTIALTQPITDMAVLERTLRSIAKRAPWLPVAAWTTAEARFQLDITLPSMRELTGAHATLVLPAGGTHPLVVEVLEAIARRAPPRAAQLAAWCGSRLGRPDLVKDLTTAMDPIRRLPPPGDDRALRRRLSKEGLPPRLALSRIHLLAGAYRLDRPITEAATMIGLTPQQLRTWLERLAGSTPERWVQQPGWEWLVEEMLRRSGTKAARRPLVSVPAASPAGVPAQAAAG